MAYFSKKQLIIGVVTFSVLVLATTIGLLLNNSSTSYLNDAIALVDSELVDSGFEHGDTIEILEKYQDVTIDWESTDIVVGEDGLVNAIGLTSDVEVNIIVTFTENGTDVTKNYFVTVFMITDVNQVVDCEINPNHPSCSDNEVTADQQKINLVKTNLILPTQTMEDLSLLTTSNGVDISWSSDNTAISETGELTRSIDQDITVTLTATFTTGETTDTKVFTIIVLQVDVIEEAKAVLDLPSSIEGEITLLETLGVDYPVTITWSSDNAAISNSGVVTRSLTDNVTVTLTATLTFGDDTDTKTFVVTVLKDSTLDEAYTNLVLEDIIVRDIFLQNSIGPVNISWESSNLVVLSNEGVITQTSTDVQVQLTATLTYGEHTQTKLFDLTIKKEPTNKLSTPFGFVWISEHKFFAYASITESGYSGLMMAIFETAGEDPYIYTTASVGGQFTILPILEDIANGKVYTITFIALGDGINYGDSDPSGAITFSHELIALDPPTNVTVTDGVLTWNEILDAERYEIYSQKGTDAEILLATIYAGESLELTLPTELGIYSIDVVAKAPLRSSSTTSITYINSSDTLITPDTPVITLDAVDNIITWAAIPNAESYEVTIDGTAVLTNELSFDLETAVDDQGTYQVSIRAIGDQVYYGVSETSNTVSFTKDTPTVRVDASGLLFQNNIAGHYSIERPGVFSPDGWVVGEYIVQIYQGTTLLSETTISDSGTVIHIQMPDQAGLLSDLAPGTYIAKVIMVGNETTHANSEPVEFTVNYAG